MADTDLPVTGKSVSVTLLLGGVVKKITDQVTSFSAKPMITVIDTKTLGVSGSKVDTEYDGWEGSIELATSSKDFDEVIDAMESASRLRLPLSFIVSETINYADLSSVRHTYVECKLTSADVSNSRGQARKGTLAWKTGKQRVTS